MIENEYNYSPDGRAYDAQSGQRIREHKTIVTARWGEVDADLLPYLQKKQKEIDEQKPKYTSTAPVKMPICPIADGVNTICKGDACAWHHSFKGCALAGSDPAEHDTKGRRCPMRNNTCIEDCALYKKGCTYIKL